MILVETYFDDVTYLFGSWNLLAVENLIDLNEFSFWGGQIGVERGISWVTVLFKMLLGMVT